MAYTQDQGRRFWHDFDKHFRYEAAQNGLLDIYTNLGGYEAAAEAWRGERAGETGAFSGFVDNHRDSIAHLAAEQERFFETAFSERAEIEAAFQDFAFGVLESADADHRADADDTSHTMSGGIYTDGYLHWHGFIEAALALQPESDFWAFLRKANGMAWELHVRAHPHESNPGRYERLPEAETRAVRDRWFSLTSEEIAAEFDAYAGRPDEWLAQSGRAN